MRVVAGSWRGRRLVAPAGDQVRPTTDRTKEALFSILGPLTAGLRVVDLCCGAGGLGIEALSRGAAHVTFVDRAEAALAAAEANLARCGAESGTWAIRRAEAAAWLAAWPGADGRAWVLLCDPPYASTLAGEVMALLRGGGVPAGLQAAVVEYGAETPGLPAWLAEDVPGWQIRRYGASRLAIHRPAAAPPKEGRT